MLYFFKPTNEELNKNIPTVFKVYMEYDTDHILKDAIYGNPIEYNGELYYNALLKSNFKTGNTDHELTDDELNIWLNYTSNNLYIYVYDETLEKEIMVKYE